MTKLVRYIFSIITALLISHSGFSQRRVLVPAQPYRPAPVYTQQQRNVVRNAGGGKRTQAIKENFLAQRLNLTAKEARAFWPLYRRYTEEITAVRILKRQNNSNASVDGSEQVKRDLDYDSQIVNIKKNYSDQFMKIISPEKVSMLYKAEREFNDEVVRILSEKSIRAGD